METLAELYLDRVAYPFQTRIVGFQSPIIKDSVEHIGMIKSLMMLANVNVLEKTYGSSTKKITWSDLNDN